MKLSGVSFHFAKYVQHKTISDNANNIDPTNIVFRHKLEKSFWKTKAPEIQIVQNNINEYITADNLNLQ